jgi:low affinity Fe/Cu permease
MKIHAPIKQTYIHIERYFEKLTSAVTAVLGNSISFLVAFFTVIYFLTNEEFYSQSLHKCLGEAFLAISFLSLFIIQKAFNRFSGSLHLKVNELVASTETANNSVINVEHKTEKEVIELQKEFTELVEQQHENQNPEPKLEDKLADKKALHK